MKAGIDRILIPIKPEDLTIESVLPYLPNILAQFQQNATKIRKNYDVYCLDHDILDKTRPHDDTSSINNKVLEPHIKGMIEWKMGYIAGQPIKYAQSKDTQTDDIEYLNKYARSSNKSSVDKEVLSWVYATGVGYYFIEPKKGETDIDEAPFELFCRDADTCCKVYSSYNGKKPLFDFLYTTVNEIQANGREKSFTIIDIYLPDVFYEFKLEDISKIPKEEQVISVMNRVYNKLPLVEKRLLNGIGIVETAKLLQDAVDKIASNSLDNVEEFSNVLFKYKNVSLGETEEEKKKTHQSILKNGAVEITAGEGVDADVEILQTELLNLKDVDTLSDKLIDVMYSTVGVPRPTSNTNSGGTTKQGSEVANGYENAYNLALNDVNDYIQGDRELLKNILFICQSLPENKVDKLKASEIEIKYCYNLTDNMLIKSQSAGTLYNLNMPLSLILEKCKMSNDPEAEGKLWETRDNELREKQDNKKVIENIDVNEPKAQ